MMIMQKTITYEFPNNHFFKIINSIYLKYVVLIQIWNNWELI